MVTVSHHQPHHHLKKTKKRTNKNNNKGAPIDHIVYFFAFATPIFELPQVYLIFVEHSIIGVSILTWGFFVLSSFTWLIYAIHKKIIPLIISYFLFFIIECLIVVGIFYYS